MLGATLLVGCEFKMEMITLSMWKGFPEINSWRGLACLLVFSATSTKSVITLYWEVQWEFGLLYWKINFKSVPSSPMELQILRERTVVAKSLCRSERHPNSSKQGFKVRFSWSGSIWSKHDMPVYFLLFASSKCSCTILFTYILKYNNQCRIFR
jgi:hypothetical protein